MKAQPVHSLGVARHPLLDHADITSIVVAENAHACRVTTAAHEEGASKNMSIDKTVRVAGVPFRATALEVAARETVDRCVEHRDAPAIRLMNAYCVALASDDPEYFALVTSSGINYPDGAPVAWVMRRGGTPEAKQVRGPSFFLKVIELGTARGMRHYFFGTTDETLSLLEERLKKDQPDVVVAGLGAAPFGPVSEILTDEVVEEIRATNPDIVWVGLGTPKQDFVAVELAKRLGVPCAGVGAAFDFAAGTQPEAHPLIRRFGLEWAYRLSTEPRRLWRRYLWGNTRFITLAARQLLPGGKVRAS